jgi:hypothetical protein
VFVLSGPLLATRRRNKDLMTRIQPNTALEPTPTAP